MALVYYVYLVNFTVLVYCNYY